jgi:type IV secretion system protein TrbL
MYRLTRGSRASGPQLAPVGGVRKLNWRYIAAAVVVTIAVMTVLGEPVYGQTLNRAQDFYRTTARSWLGPMEGIARRLYVSLATLEVAVGALTWFGRRDGMDEMAAKFLLKFVLLSFVLLLITGAGFWLPPLINGLAAAGQSAGVVAPPATPTEVVDTGKYIAFTVISTDGVPITPDSFAALFFALGARFVAFASFAMVAVMLVLAWVESYVALGAGVLFLGFGGFRATAQYADNYLNYLFYLGIRLFAVYLLITIGTAIVQAFIPPTMKATNSQAQAVVAVTCLVFAVLTIRIPGNMANRIAAGGNFGIAHALRNL